MRWLSLAVVLLGLWLTLSGHYTPMLVAAGAVSTAVCVFAAIRMRTLDREGHPIELLPGTITYYPWLLREIAKSAWGVTRIILHPALPVSPCMTVVRGSQTTPAGLATYANSITLTPGTVTAGVNGNELTVHALVRDGAIELEAGVMNRRVREFEGKV